MKKLSILLPIIFIILAACHMAYASDALMPDILPYPTGNAFSFGETDEAPSVPVSAAVPSEAPWNYPVSREIFSDTEDILRLVNREYLLDRDYPPADELHALVDTAVRKTSGSPIKARKIASEALDAMFAAADADGIKLYLHSGYRSYQTQATMYDRRLENIGRDDGVVQKSGASDHQTGLGFDVISWAWRDSRLNAGFAQTGEAQWMAAHCADYGFIVRYPEGKEEITGIIFEPWHLRYVGTEAAQYMTGFALTLEEFTVEWKSALVEYGAQSGRSQPTSDGGGKPAEDSFSF